MNKLQLAQLIYTLDRQINDLADKAALVVDECKSEGNVLNKQSIVLEGLIYMMQVPGKMEAQKTLALLALLPEWTWQLAECFTLLEEYQQNTNRLWLSWQMEE